MPYIVIKRDGPSTYYDYFRVIDRDCIGRACFEPKEYYYKRSAILGRPANPNEKIKICRNYYEKTDDSKELRCPKELPRVNVQLRDIREAKGWTIKEI